MRNYCDNSAQGFGGDRHHRAFFDVRVFHPNAPSYRKMQLPSAYRLHECQKQRSYDQRVREVEYGSFTPLILSTSGGMGKCASVTYKRIASLLSTKQEQHYGATIARIRCCLNFSLLRSSIMCLRGARSASIQIQCNRSSCCRSQGPVSIYLMHSLCPHPCTYFC